MPEKPNSRFSHSVRLALLTFLSDMLQTVTTIITNMTVQRELLLLYHSIYLSPTDNATS